MRVAFFLWSLSEGKGGAERAGAELANYLCRQGHEVIVFLNGLQPLPTSYPLLPQVRREYNSTALLAQCQGLAELRRQLRAHDPDVFVVLASTSTMLAGVSMVAGTGIPLVISERSDPDAVERERWNRPDRQAAFSGADRIHLLLEKYRASLHPCLRERVRVIPNACSMPEYGPTDQQERVAKGEEHRPPHILAVGRLRDDIKQHSLLIEAFALLHAEFPDWRLQIWGEGRDRSLLEEKIAAVRMTKRIFLRGRHEHIESAYKEARLFCHPSRYEGFPNVVIEAMRHSLPVVGLAACSALREIVAPDIGSLAPENSASGLAEALRPLLADAALRRDMGRAACRAARRYLPETVYGQWEELLGEAAAAKGRTRLQVPVRQGPRFGLRRRLETFGAFSQPDGAAGNDAWFFPPVGADNPCRKQENAWRLMLTLLEDSGLFDRAWYRKAYVHGPEFMDPLEHYLRFGADKGNDPSAFFSTTWYRARYMKGEWARLNPLLHYCLRGRARGFAPCPPPVKEAKP